MNRTQKNKATAHHLGMLKAKLAKLKRELLAPTKGAGGGAGEGMITPSLLFMLFLFLHVEHIFTLWQVLM